MAFRALEVPAACEASRKRAQELRSGLEPLVPASEREVATRIATDREPGVSEAEGWDQAATIAALEGRKLAAAWSELRSIALEWDAGNVMDAASYLAWLGMNEEALALLHCSFSMGNRSPYLFEAFAIVRERTGDKEAARRDIRKAREQAPDDRLIESEASLLETGKLPPPRRRRDALDEALWRLQLHQARVLAAVRDYDELVQHVDRALGRPSGAAMQAEGVRQSFAEGNAAVAGMRQQASNPDMRNLVLATYITLYFNATEQLLQQFNRLVTYEGFDVGFWGDAMRLPPVQYAALIRELRDYRFAGFSGGRSGYRFVDYGGAPFVAMGQQAASQLSQETRACGDAECRHQANVRYCDRMRKLFTEWVDTTEAVQNTAALRYDATAEGYLVVGGAIVADAYEYGSRTASEIKLRRGGDPLDDMVRDLNRDYRRLVAMAADLRGATSGPANLVARAGQKFASMRAEAENDMRQEGQKLQRYCSPVEQKSLERHREELRDATSALLLYYLTRDLNVGLDPPSCTLNVGKHFSAKVDMRNDVSLGGKATPLKKAFGGDPGNPAVDADLARIGKVSVKSDSIAVSGGGQGTVKGGPFSVTGDITIGVKYDANGKVSFPVDVGVSPAIGWKNDKGFGGSCSPGKLTLKFDARVTLDQAVSYIDSLK